VVLIIRSINLLLKKSFYCFALLILLISASCRQRKGLPIKPKEEIKPIVDNRPALQLVKKQKEHELLFNTFTAKASVDSEINGETQSFDATIRVKKDSAIWISISPALGIEVMRVLITQDTVKYMNRLNNSYFIDAVCNINKLIDADFDFDMIQNILVGNSFDYYDDDRLKTSIEDNNYLLSSVKKGKLKRLTNEDKPQERASIQSMWLEPLNFKMVKLRLDEFTSQRELITEFSNFKTIDSIQTMANTINVNIKAKKNAVIKVNYTKAKINQPAEMPFKIPTKYTRK
jgi:hypothetical protein